MQNAQKDTDRMRKEYANRFIRLKGTNLYSHFNPSYLFTLQQRERELVNLLRSHDLNDLSGINILEVGCGSGGVLLDFLKYGLEPTHITGIDLLHHSLTSARLRLPAAKLYAADGQQLPFTAKSFDLILQFTAFSSLLDQQVKQNIALEMLRVLKDDGAILWYDFWWNPTNRQTAGIKPKEIKRLFPNCEYVFRKITLAPPIARRIVPISWSFALFLESLKFLNSHYLVLIKRQTD